MELCNTCTFNCVLCPRNTVSFAPLIMQPNIRDPKRVMDQISSFGPSLKTVCLCGQMSEPTTYPFLRDIILFIKRKGLALEMFTNGFWTNHLHMEDVAGMLDYRDNIIITVCGSNDTFHTQYRRKGNLEYCRLVSKYFPNNSTAMVIRFNYNRHNIETDDMRRFLASFHRHKVINSSSFLGSPLLEDLGSHDSDFYPPEPANKIWKLIDCEARTGLSIRMSEVICDCYDSRRLFVDYKGNVWPYSSMFQENVETRGGCLDWNEENIRRGKYLCCRRCTRIARERMDQYDLDC